MIKYFLALFLALFIPLSYAVVPAWKIVPEKSNLSFTATQNNAPVKGEFKNFSGTINFDPNDLPNSNIKIIVDINSVKTSYPEVADNLKMEPWFDVNVFPRAVFKAKKFTKGANNSYQAHGTLTIRDKAIPVTLNFVLEDYGTDTAKVTGSTTLQRTLFGIGKGEWEKTNEVKDDVLVNFVLTTQK